MTSVRESGGERGRQREAREKNRGRVREQRERGGLDGMRDWLQRLIERI